MNTSYKIIPDPKIEKCLDELADEYKELLFSALVSKSNSRDKLSVSDLIKIDGEVKRPLFKEYKTQIKRQKAILTIGILYMFLAIVIFLGFLFDESFDSMITINKDFLTVMSITFSVLGCIMSVLSYLFSLLAKKAVLIKNRTQKVNIELLEYIVVIKWRELEGVVNDICSGQTVKTAKSVITFLKDNQLIDQDEYVQLKNFLRLRNNIVHSDESNYTAEEIEKAINNIEVIINKCKKIFS